MRTKHKKNLIFYILLTLTLLPILVKAENTITPITLQQLSQPALTPAEVQDFYIREEIKTRNDFKGYTDAKLAEWRQWVETEGQKRLDENFTKLWQGLRQLAQDIFIKFTIGAIFVIILANAIWYLIQKKIEDLAVRPNSITEEQYVKIVSGIITQEYKDDITKNNNRLADVEKPLYKDIEPKLDVPSIEQINRMIEDNKNKKLIEREIRAKKKENEERKKKENEIQKKMEKLDKKRKEKLDKINEERLKLEKEQEKINKEIQKLSPVPPPNPPLRELDNPPIPPKIFLNLKD